MPRPAPRLALVALATLVALAAAPSPARAVTPGSASARRALAATLVGDGHRHVPAARPRCPAEPVTESGGAGRLALTVERQLARWSDGARRWATDRVALAVYVADVTGLSDLADRLTGTSA